jgi:carboxypeptidase PM20D1
MSTIGKVLLGISGAIVLLIAVLLIRTFSYGGPLEVVDVPLPEVPEVSAESAAQNLSRAIQFQTVSIRRGGPAPEEAGPWLEMHAWLEETYPGVHATLQKELVADYTLLFTWQGSNPALKPIVLMAHQDVVPINIGTYEDWTGAPFKGEIIDGHVYGRGALDDKNALIALMEAAETLIESGFQPQRTVYFLFGHDEEVSGSGAEAGIALLKSRGVEAEMALDEGMWAMKSSPLTGGPVGYIGIAEKGYLNVRITATGTGGHSSMPPQDSATVRLARALVALDENQMPADFSTPPTSDLLSSSAADMPFMTRMAFANRWLFGSMIETQMSAEPAANATIRTTIAPTVLQGSAKANVLAQRASAIVNFRIHPNDTEEDILAHIANVTRDIPGLTIEQGEQGIRGTGASPVSPTDNRAYGVLTAVASNLTDDAPVAPALVIGATDGRYATAITDSVYRFAPAFIPTEDLSGFHGTNERISIENMGNMVRGYAQIILAMDEEG